jgi:hypothetical protein
MDGRDDEPTCVVFAASVCTFDRRLRRAGQPDAGRPGANGCADAIAPAQRYAHGDKHAHGDRNPDGLTHGHGYRNADRDADRNAIPHTRCVRAVDG